MFRTRNEVVSLLVALAIGLALAWVDARPNFDDTAILVGLLLIGALLAGALLARVPWLAALAVGLWIALRGIPSGNWPSLIALAVAFVGAYGGALLRHALPQTV